MKKIMFVLLVTVFASSLWASTEKKGILRSLYDVVAPVLGGEPAAADREVGQIFYDNVAGAFKGVNKNGGIDVLGSGGTLPKAKGIDATESLISIVDGSTQIIFPTEDFDTASMYDPITGSFTVPSAGIYNVSSSLRVGGPFLDPGDYVSIGVYVNGNGAAGTFTDYVVQSSTNVVTANLNSDISLQAGDIVQIWISVYQASEVPFPSVSHLGGFASLKKLP